MLSSRNLGVVIIACVVYNLLVVLAMHVLQPAFSPIRVPMSAYVMSPYGGLVSTSYFVWCAALLSMGYALATSLPRTGVTRAAFFLIVIAAAAFVLAGIFPIEFPGPPQTLPGRLHLLGGLLGFPSMSFGLFLFSLSLRRHQEWKTVSKALLLLSSGLVAVFILGIGSMIVLGYAAYLQRLFVALLSGWMILVGLHLARSKQKALTDCAAGSLTARRHQKPLR